MRVALLAASLAIAACASGMNAGPPTIDAETAKDATIDSKAIDPDPIDAPPVAIDAPAALPDAPPPDAPPSGGFCSRNDQCPHPDECCANIDGVGYCVPGWEVGDDCIPKPE